MQEAGREMHGSPVLWLRMAEACLGGYHDLKQTPAIETNGRSSAGQAVADLVGKHVPCGMQLPFRSWSCCLLQNNDSGVGMCQSS